MSATAELISGADIVASGAIIRQGWILVAAGRIEAIGTRAERPPPARIRTRLPGASILPGFVDPHVHGGGGSVFGADLAAARRAARFHLLAGTTSLLAGLVTSPAPQLLRQVRRLGACGEELDGGARLLGMHLEGPFISMARRGAHDPAQVRPPDPAELAALAATAPGRIRLLTAAPEVDGFAGLARAADAAGVRLAAGHTDADGPGLLRAIHRGGVGSLTHTFNGMRPGSHREPGPLAAIVDSEVWCEVICDGLHVHPAVVRMLWQLAGCERLVLVTDAAAWAGEPDGTYQSGRGPVTVRGSRVQRDGVLAGSTLTMAEAVRNFARFTGAGLAELAAVSATNAARMLGEEHRIGQLRRGHLADLVVLDQQLNCTGVMAGGTWVRYPERTPAEHADRTRRP